MSEGDIQTAARTSPFDHFTADLFLKLGPHQCFVEYCIAGMGHSGARPGEAADQIAITDYHAVTVPFRIGLANSLSIGSSGVGSVESFERR